MKSLALVAICKNEERHIERWLTSFLRVVDHVYLCDTGSTDQTVAIAKVVGKNKITIKHFDWIEDFAAARNFAQQGVKEDYILWSDLDDSLRHPDGFADWRRTSMATCDMWFANYNYALHPDGTSACTFIRERVFKNNPKFVWKGFTHEGLDCSGPTTTQFTNAWAIDHLRSPEDLAADKGRNVGIFDRKKAAGVEFDSRALYYHGKELFEAGRHDEALKSLMAANCKTDLQHHDRVLCIQYGTYILMSKNEFVQAINLAMSGLLIAPQRAEFYVLIADCFIKMERFKDAIPYYEAAKACEPLPENGFGGFIFQNRIAYTEYPRNQLSRIWAQLGQHERGADEAKRSYELYKSEESRSLFEACSNIIVAANKYKTAKDDDAIVFTCPGGLYEWDSKVHRERGIGGSETACVEMATWLKKLTSKSVIVFNQRKEAFTDADGVDYRPLDHMHGYFAENKPTLHCAWRHNFKMTNAKTLVWSHDLIVPGGEKSSDYDLYLALSEFHKDYVKSALGISDAKIVISPNGIDPEKFKPIDHDIKNPNKVIFVSSPDRGLKRAIEVCEIARTTLPDLELHCFYGLDNLRKMGKVAEVEYFEKLMDRPWIINHGNLPQKDLMEHYRSASVWLYPTDFTETHCISALETVCSGVYPLVRNYGALPFTLKPYIEKGFATCLDLDCETFQEKIQWAAELCKVINEKKWERLVVHPNEHSWKNIATNWIRDFL